jgi:hypothetical protein
VNDVSFLQTMAWRIGQFFLFLGFLFLAYFYVTDQARDPSYLFFCFGLLIVIFGVYLMFRHSTPKPPSGRFRILRGQKDQDSGEDNE